MPRLSSKRGADRTNTMASRRRAPTALIAALSLALTGCSVAGQRPDPAPTAATPSTAARDSETMTDTPNQADTPITITFDGTVVTATLTDSAPSRALLDQLPLTVSFTDFGGQEKIAPLPGPLPLDGMPAGSDADPLTIGYYAPDQALVLYYDHVGYFTGITRLGTFDQLAPIRDHESDFTATLDTAD